MADDHELLDDPELPKISTGNAGLDDILGGGIDPERMYLFEGQPGSGKTTLALEFLLEGVRRSEPTLYITLSETERELRLVAKRHGWSLKGITIFELIPPETSLDPSQELTVLQPAEMELSETTQMIFERPLKAITRVQIGQTGCAVGKFVTRCPRATWPRVQRKDESRREGAPAPGPFQTSGCRARRG
jgi:replicative DNA helicase